MEFGKLLLQSGLVSQQQLELARTQAEGRRVDQVLVEMGALSEEQALQALADDLGMRYLDVKDFDVDRELLVQFPTTAIFRHSLFPLVRVNGFVDVATSDPFDLEALDELSSLSGFQLRPVLACREDVVRLIKENLGVGGDTITELVARAAEDDVELLEDISVQDGELVDDAQAASVIRLVNELLVEALSQRASDVHIEPHDTGLTVRFRVDGMLHPQPVPPEINQFYTAIVTRLKIMARMNIAEKRLPQDGRIKLRISGREIDVRASVIPMLYGEGVVLRLLDKDRMTFSLKVVGMPAEIAEPFKVLITLPHGIVLVTGPTSSVKMITLYGASNEIKDAATKLITV